MKKNICTHKALGTFSVFQNIINQFLRKKTPTAKNIGQFSINLSTLDQEKYIHSFLKKRILIAWQAQRSSIHIPYPHSLEKQIYQNTYHQLKPMLIASYTEDFTLPYTEFTFRSWLQYVTLLAQVIGRHGEARCWKELSDFISRCAKLNVIDS